MFVLSFKASSVKVIGIICLCLIAAVMLISFLPQTGAYLNVNKLDISKTLSDINVKKEQGRLDYFSALGYSVDKENSVQTSEKIPEVFDSVTEKYNELQRVQGFDLKRLGGKNVTGYTYNVSALPDGSDVSGLGYLATLIVYKNKVVAADLCCPERDVYYPLVALS